jgi:hypothetical protein
VGLRLHERRWVKFWRPPEPVPQAANELEIVPVDRTSADRFADAVLAGFGMPPALKPWLMALPGREGWHCFLALAGGVAVAGAAIPDRLRPAELGALILRACPAP